MLKLTREEAKKCWTKPLGFTKFNWKGRTAVVPHGPFQPEIFFYHIMSRKDAISNEFISEDDFDDRWIVMGTNPDMHCTEPYCDFKTIPEAIEYMEEQALDSSKRWLKV